MLTAKVLKFNFYSYRICGFFGFLPFRLKGYKLYGSQLCVLHKIWLLCSVLHTVYTGFRLREYISDPHQAMTNLPLHAICFIGGVNANYWSRKIFVIRRDIFQGIFNDAIARLPERPSGRRDLQDLLVLTLPSSFLCASLMYLTCLFFNPESPQFLSSIISKRSLRWWVICVTADYCIFFFWISTYNIALTTQLLFFKTSEFGLDNAVNRVRSLAPADVESLQKFCRFLRVQQLRVSFFNKTFAGAIYSLKLTSLSIGIVGYFFSLKLSHTEPLMAALSGCLATISCLSYTLVYDHGFDVPVKVELLKQEILFAVTNVREEGQGYGRLVLTREAHSIGDTRVVVGDLYALERFSTPAFIAFCFSSVCNLIVSFPDDM